MPSAIGRGKTRASRNVSPPRARKSALSTLAWVEPPTEDDKPSYDKAQEKSYGGVLEDMQPLGQPPSAKVRNRIKDTGSRKSLGRNQRLIQEFTVPIVPASTFDTPEPPAAVEEQPAPAEQPTADENEDPATAMDVDHAAKTRSGRRSGRTRRNRASSAASETAKIPSPPLDATELEVTSLDAALPAQVNDASEDDIDQANYRIVVQIAEDRARELGFDLFADALNKLYVDSAANKRYSYLLRAVLLQSDTEDERLEFQKLIAANKKALKAQKADDAQMQENGHVESSTASTPESDTIARPSIETAPKGPKFRLSLKKGPRAAAAADGAQEKSSRRSARISRGHARLTSPAESAVSDETEAIISASRADIDRATSISSRGSLRPNGVTNGHGRLHLTLKKARTGASRVDELSETSELPRSDSAELLSATQDDCAMEDVPPTERALKRSPGVAGLDADTLDAIETAKRRKFDGTIYQHAPPQNQFDQSHVRQSTESSVIQLATPNGVNSRSARAASESSLSSMSSTPPLEDSYAELQATKGVRKAKTKQSPVKKRTGPIDGGDDQGMEDGEQNYEQQESDHNDNCNACGGRGELVCCDGCEKAYHYVCVDPPLTADSPALQEAWYCPQCDARLHPSRHSRGLFSSLLTALDKRGPINFKLPQELQRYYAGVGVGKDGKFEDATAAKPGRANRSGYDEPFDLYRQRDSKGNPVICYHCSRAAEFNRGMVTCDVCATHWHLQCVNPPLVSPPFRDHYGRKVRDWICPLHVEHDLAAIDPIRLAKRRRVRVRRPKVAKVVDTALNRGLVNNGIIEIAEDSSSEEDFDDDDEDDADSDAGVVYRVSSKGVKLDFIDKVHRVRAAELSQAQPLPPPYPTRMTADVLNAHLQSRPVDERHAALSLAQFGGADLLSGNAVSDLINVLTVEAPRDVLARVAGDEGKGRRERLLELQRLIAGELEGSV